MHDPNRRRLRECAGMSLEALVALFGAWLSLLVCFPDDGSACDQECEAIDRRLNRAR